MQFYVYEHWRTDRDECFYVGKGKGRRAYNMKRRNFHHTAIQKKVYKEGYAVEVKIVISGLTEEQAFDLEKKRIAFWRSLNVDLSNMADGGGGSSGYKHLPETIEKLSVANKGKPAHNKGSKISEETKEKIRRSRIGIKRKDEVKEKIKNTLTGRKHSDERKAKLKEAWKKRRLKRNILCGSESFSPDE